MLGISKPSNVKLPCISMLGVGRMSKWADPEGGTGGPDPPGKLQVMGFYRE